MSERDSERFDLDDDFLAEQQEDGNDYDRLLDRVDKRTRDKTKKVGKAAWSKLEEVLAERKLKRDLSDYDDYEAE
jgi:ferritin